MRCVLTLLSERKCSGSRGKPTCCVQVGDTTFEVIRENAAQLKQLAGQQPPRAACKVGCWVPQSHSGTFSTVNRCGFAHASLQQHAAMYLF